MIDFIVCSFHTDDEYYRRHGKELEENLSDLGVRYVIDEVVKEEGQDWADLCRRKVPFLQRICAENPGSKVFWIDVDCRLLSLPDFVRDSSADIIGFQRGFSNPRAIGYHKRSRFWEPCFWGVNATPQARQMISDAAELEARSPTKATDDFFFEEGWRANAADLTWQMIPSSCVVGKGGPHTSRSAFFAFGSSGNVADFKDKVVQHTSEAPSVTALAGSLAPASARRRVIKTGKKVLAQLPPTWRRRVVAAVDKSGVTGFLIPSSPTGPGRPGLPQAKQRKALLNQILRTGLDGDLPGLEVASNELLGIGVPTPDERATLSAARSFAHYAARPSMEELSLVWWTRPFPGNYGDWLSPLLVGHYTDARIKYQSPTTSTLTSGRHLISVGSIGRFIKPNSVVVGTGLSSDEFHLDASAEYVSLRGPVSAEHLRSCGGPVVESFGDPAAVLSRVIRISRGSTNGRTAFVRHFKHRNLPVILPTDSDELEVMASHPEAIRELVTRLAEYDRVVTSAMHILITCQSYGIPCALVVFEGHLDAIAGNGMKYTDYSLGVGLGPLDPTPVPLDLRSVDVGSLVLDVIISEAKKDEVEDALRRAVAAVTR